MRTISPVKYSNKLDFIPQYLQVWAGTAKASEIGGGGEGGQQNSEQYFIAKQRRRDRRDMLCVVLQI